MVYRNNTGRLGCWLHQCVLRNTLAGSKTVVSTSRDDPVSWKWWSQQFRTHQFWFSSELLVDCTCYNLATVNTCGLLYPRQSDSRSTRAGLLMGSVFFSSSCHLGHQSIIPTYFSKIPDFPIFRTFKQIDLIEQIVLIMLTWTVKNVIGHCSYYTATVLEGYNSKVIATGDWQDRGQ